MQSSNPNDMNIVERVVAPYPPFFKKLRTIGLILGGVSAAILTGGAALPAVVISIAGLFGNCFGGCGDGKSVYG